jgi:hypothetical protein
MRNFCVFRDGRFHLERDKTMGVVARVAWAGIALVEG